MWNEIILYISKITIPRLGDISSIVYAFDILNPQMKIIILLNA